MKQIHDTQTGYTIIWRSGTVDALNQKYSSRNAPSITLILACVALTAVFGLAFRSNYFNDQRANQATGENTKLPLPTPSSSHPTASPPAKALSDVQLASFDANKAGNSLTNASDSTLVRFSSPDAANIFFAANSINQAKEVRYIAAINTYQIARTSLTPTPGSRLYTNQPYTALLTAYDPQISNQWHLDRINVSPAWNSQRGSSSVIVAVIDNGFGVNHQDLINQWSIHSGESGPTIHEGPTPNCSSRGTGLDKRCNNLDDDNDGFVDNYLGWNFVDNTNDVSAGKTAPTDVGAGHGTATASLIGAQANNAAFGSGVSWNSRLLPIQALDDTGSGNTLSVALSINYAVMRGAKVINMSLGSASDDPIVAEQIQYAINNNVTVVAASGNDNCDCISFPARYTGVISVGSLTSSGTRASYSNYGAQLDIMAPGSGICTSVWTQSQPTTGFSCGLNGTSFASPLIAGAAALLLSQNPLLTPSQVSVAITNTASKLPPMNGLNRTNTYGFGLLNVNDALRSVSVAQPTGKPLSTGVVILSQLSNPTTFVTESMTSACRTVMVNATCRLQIISSASNAVIVVTESTPIGVNNLLTDFKNANIAPGDYTMQAQINNGGIWSTVSQSTLRVVP